MVMNEKLKIDPQTIFYHGTDTFFEHFDEQYRGSNTGWDNTVHGFFFADKREHALLFGETVITAHLDIRDPLDLRLYSIFSVENQASLIWEILTGDKLDNKEALQTLYDEISLGEIADMYGSLHGEDAHLMMERAGYDGIVSDLGDEQSEYVAFNARQITILSIDRILSAGRTR